MFSYNFILLQRSEGGGLGIGQLVVLVVLVTFLRPEVPLIFYKNHFSCFCFFLTSLSLVFITNSNYNQESIIDSSDDSIIDRLDLIPEEFDVEKLDDNELNVPTE